MKTLRVALDTSKMHPKYVNDMGWANLVTLWTAAAVSGHLEVVDKVCFSWLRWPETPSFPPDHDEWTSVEGKLWIADVVAHPEISGIQVGKVLRRELVRRGIAREGEKVYFFRYRTDRFGSFIARK